jgi:signal recognition particle receptor subunit beta
MKVEWDDFVIRRSIKFSEFCEQFNIKTKEDLVVVCNKFDVNPPSNLQLSSLFPSVKEKKHVEVVETPVEIEVVEEVVSKKSKKNQGVEKK